VTDDSHDEYDVQEDPMGAKNLDFEDDDDSVSDREEPELVEIEELTQE